MEKAVKGPAGQGDSTPRSPGPQAPPRRRMSRAVVHRHTLMASPVCGAVRTTV